MEAWPSPFVPAVPGAGRPVVVYDSSSGALLPAATGPTVRIYVCGITPYDATHLGHAATYVTFDVLGRALRDAGHHVRYVQNVTDIDDPLLERAERDDVDWQELARDQIALFREDMTALGVVAPEDYVGVVEVIPAVAQVVRDLVTRGAAYEVAVQDDAPAGARGDIYFDLATEPSFGSVSGWTREQMAEVFADRGGDPDRPGKRDAFDPLLWRAARRGEPAWDGGTLGPGRPGWHVECSSIALDLLGAAFDVQGGGSDLVFPHHEMSAVQAVRLTDGEPFARIYLHQAMVGLHGEKMSKSRGNLVLVSALRRAGVEPMVIRLALLDHHYRTDWDWDDEVLKAAQDRYELWREALAVNAAPDAARTVDVMRRRLADDLDTPGALAAVDEWAHRCLEYGGDDAAAPGLVGRAVDALLGVRL